MAGARIPISYSTHFLHARALTMSSWHFRPRARQKEFHGVFIGVFVGAAVITIVTVTFITLGSVDVLDAMPTQSGRNYATTRCKRPITE